MAPRALFAVAVMAALCSWASAQPGCTSTMVNLTPCLSYITGNVSGAPPAACCSQLDTIVQTQRGCLCAVLTSAATFGITVSQTQALSLPGACNIKTAPLSQCNAAAATPPVSSPVAPGPTSPATPSTPSDVPSPSETSPGTTPPAPSTQNPPAGSGSKTVPAGPAAAGDSAKLGAHSLFFCFLVAVTSYASSGVFSF